MRVDRDNHRQQTLNRQSFLKLMAAGTVAAALPGLSCAPTGRKGKPNIIFILADDLGYGDIGAFGQTRIRTPHIDRLAAEGIKLTDFYAGSTVCAPSRSCLMTGLHTGHTRVRGNSSKVTQERVPLLPEDTTVAEVLKKAGYATGIMGKWGLGDPGTTGTPNRKGFDHWFGYLNQRNAHLYYPEYLWRNENKVVLEDNLEDQQGSYSHDLIVAEALDFIRSHKEEPFFLYLPFTIPHVELLVPEESLKEYEGAFPEPNPFIQTPGEHRHTQMTPRAAYAAMITRMDRDIGRLMDLLKRLGIDDQTLVFFTSDNGAGRGSGYDPEFFNSTGLFRGFKRDLYEGGIRVPTIVRWPGKIRAGTESGHVGAFWDFLPTATELAGMKPPDNLDGISFLPTLLGHDSRQKQHEYLYWEFATRGRSSQAVRMGAWKAVRLTPTSATELYDLSTDVGEERNVAARHPDVVARAEALFRSEHTPSQDWPIPELD